MNAIPTSAEAGRLAALLSAELMRGERVLWQGMPDPRRLRIGLVAWIFAIPWTLFALAWTGIALAAYLSSIDSQGSSIASWGWIMPLWGTPFIAVGLWMMYAPLKTISEARHTLHALTNARLITLTAHGEKKVKSVSIAHTGPVTCTEKRDGWGSFSVETGSHKDSEGDRVTDRFEMTGIADVTRLHRQFLEARDGL
jgi:hypothetical protein